MQRRRLLRAAGAASALALADVAVGDDAVRGDERVPGDDVVGDDAVRQRERPTCSLPRCIHPRLGYAGFSFDDLAGLPPDLLPDHQVDLVTRPEGDSDGDGGGRPGSDESHRAESFFEPTGLAIESGDVVLFTPEAPGHSVGAYHPRLGRQRRVPGGVPPFSSPTLGRGDFWLYRFEAPGVYDLRDAPHELFGAAMRVVVDGGTADFGRTGSDRRPPQLTAGLVLEDDALAPEVIAERGAVGRDDLSPGSTQRLVEVRDPLADLVARFEGDGTDATEPFDLDAGPVVAVYDHEGAGRFFAELVDAAGDEPPNLVANEFDAAAGITAFGIGGGEYVLDVDAGGPWTVELARPRTTVADAEALPVTVEGDGPDYAGPFRFEGLVRATATHRGTGEFRVEGYDGAGARTAGTLFDEGGRFQGRTTFTHDGVGLITVDADGSWTIALEHVE